jgi:hypothetical protein
VETLDRQDDLFAQEWITTFVTTRDLLRRDAAPVAPVSPTQGSSTDNPGMTTPYDSWDWLD